MEYQAAGVLILASTFAALVWANSRWEYAYHGMWTAQFDIGFGHYFLSEAAPQMGWRWADVCSSYFLVGLEIKREILIGELSSLKQAAFPLIAAVGGTIVPALIYTALNRGEIAHKGWGIPMATDIAFALGMLALLGDRIPTSLKIFVTALAIVDDIIAVLVIALFYTEQIRIRKSSL